MEATGLRGTDEQPAAGPSQPIQDEIQPAAGSGPATCQDESTVRLKKVLGVGSSMALLVGIMVGSGIFVSPNEVVRYTGSVGMALIVWAVSGLLASVGALCFIELGTMIPKNGCAYTYIHEAFGEIPAFLSLWVGLLLVGPAGAAINSLTTATYLLQPLFPGCSPPFTAVKIMAILIMALLGYINCIGVKVGSKFQATLSSIKVISLLIIVISGIYYASTGSVQNFANPMRDTIWEPTSLATAFYSTWFTYSGWDALNFIAEEIKDPNRNMPLAIGLSLLTVTIIYMLTNAAYFVVLTPAEILSSNAVAVTYGTKIVSAGSWVIGLLVAISACGSANGNLVINSRQMFAAGRAGHLPFFLSFINVRNCTPVTAVIYTCLPVLITLLAGDVGVLLAYSAFSANLVILTTTCSLFWLRYKQPKRHRPFKVWTGLPILFLLVNFVITFLPVVQKPIETVVALGVGVAGLVLYFLFVYTRDKPRFVAVLMEKLTYANQLTLECVPEKES